VPGAAPSGPAATAEALAAFYAIGADRQAGDAYLAGKQRLASGRAELASMWQKVRDALDGASTVLDWGCRHGVFAWLARRELGGTAVLHGCDTVRPGTYAPFHEAAGLTYTQLEHPWLLPYPDASFDVVLAGGVLEHVPNDTMSLAELWRVLAPRGRLVLTHLPNRWSASEWLSRRRWPAQAHLRRYGLGETRRRLLHSGFAPLRSGYHHLVPATLPAGSEDGAVARWLEGLYGANDVLERVWPLNRLSATVWIVAEKRAGF
jgi:SAM-dependent methyltransferase